MAKTESLPGRTVIIDNKEYLYFSGTSYLGIPHNPVFRQLLLDGMTRYGTNYSSSRISNIQLAIYDETEKYLSKYIGTESAITVSSGFLAGQVLMSYLNGKGKFIYAPNAHPGVLLHKKDFYYGEFESWVSKLPEYFSTITEKNIYLIFNSIDPLFAKPYSFEWIQKLPSHAKITLIIDDSHGFGVIGKDGSGIYSTLKIPAHIEVVIVSSLGKALGIPGGMIAGKKDFIDMLRKSSFYGGGSPIIPAYLDAFLRAKDLYSDVRAALLKNINSFHSLIKRLHLFNHLPDYPVFYTPQNELYNFLFSKGIIISSFPYPSHEDPLITRVVINSLHTPEDLERLKEKIKLFLK